MKPISLTATASHSPPPLTLRNRQPDRQRQRGHHQSLPGPPLHFLKLQRSFSSKHSLPFQYDFKPVRHFFTVRSSKLSSAVDSDVGKDSNQLESRNEFNNVQGVKSPILPSNLPPPNFGLADQAFFLLAFIACWTTAAMVGFVAAAVPALFAMRRTAIALSKLADTARKEIPSTMAAVRLTGIEISDLIHELSDLSEEISDGVSKSSQVVQAADAGIRQIGSLARERTISMIEERANLPEISLRPVVAGAAKKTSNVVGKATRTFLNIISRSETVSENEDGAALER